MAEYDKFRPVVHDYEKRFGFDPYYGCLIDVLCRHINGDVLEIGAANGIIPGKLDLAWRGDYFDYHSVDPVAEAVDEAHKRSIHGFRHLPRVGELENALEVCGLETKPINTLVISRTLHEVFLGYNRDLDRVYDDLGGILLRKSPATTVLGILQRKEGLTDDETAKFQAEQQKTIGHSHDPATDFLDFAELAQFMRNANYSLVEDYEFVKPVPGFNPSPLKMRLGVFKP